MEEQDDSAPEWLEEQEDSAPGGVETPKNIPRRIGLVLGAAGLLFMVSAVVLGLKYFDPLLDFGIGLQSEAPFVIELDAAGIEAELARLRGLPGETLPANLGTIAEAKTACITNLMVDKPGPKAMAAATRLFVVLFAARKRTSEQVGGERRYQKIGQGTSGCAGSGLQRGRAPDLFRAGARCRRVGLPRLRKNRRHGGNQRQAGQHLLWRAGRGVALFKARWDRVARYCRAAHLSRDKSPIRPPTASSIRSSACS
jgi:hypothetical protein